MSMLEMLIAIGIATLLAVGFSWATSLYRKGLVRGAATQFVNNLSDAKTLATQARNGTATLVFRPTDALYTSYKVVTDQGEQEFKLPGGVRIVNTNGLIRGHVLRINVTGTVVSEFGEVVTAPSPGVLTFIGDDATRIYVVRINPRTGLAEVL